MTGPRIWVMLGTVAALTACGGYERDITLHDLRTNRGTPEEFAIEPKKPLLAPESLAALPTPTPGGANRTDQTPRQDAVAALGGNPSRLTPTAGVPAGDGALVNHASRLGRDGNVRADLATEDLEFRKRKSRFSWRLFKEDEYNRAYRRESLDPYGTLNASRRAGARTPTAPPAGR